MKPDRRAFRLSEHELTIGAVCARGGSKGVPRKNLRLLQGKPLLARAIEQAFATQIFDRVVTSTDDEEMAALKKPYSVYHLSEYFSEEFFQTKHVVYMPF